jgi:NADPH:quinone reductase-like Zn-dependent oxidoreductase
MGIQLARISGFEKIVVTASTVHGEYLKELGATHVLDRHTTTADDILAVVPDVKLVYDTMAKESTRLLAISILSKQGGTPLESHPFDPREIPSNITAKWVIGDFERNPSGEGGPAWAAAVKWLEEGTLRPNKTEIFEGIEKVDEALTLLSKGVSGKKVVVTFD